MYTLAIDPSFTGTGLALYKDHTLLKTSKVGKVGAVKSQIDHLHEVCHYIVSCINDFLDIPKDSQFSVAIEYPVYQTPSGALLATLSGWLSHFFCSNSQCIKVVFIPPLAVNSFTNNRSRTKTHIVQYVRLNNLISSKVSHDEATAICLAQIFFSIESGSYKHSYFLIEPPKLSSNTPSKH